MPGKFYCDIETFKIIYMQVSMLIFSELQFFDAALWKFLLIGFS